METIIDKLRTLQAAAEILGVSVKDLVDTHGQRAGVSIGSGDEDTRRRAVSTQQDGQAKTQSDLVPNIRSAPTIQYPTLSTLPAQESGPSTTYSGSGALLANDWIPASGFSLIGSSGAHPRLNGAKPDLASAPLEYLPGGISPSLSPPALTKQTTHLPVKTDLWFDAPGISIYGNGFGFPTLLGNHNDQTRETNTVEGTSLSGFMSDQISDEHLFPHENVMGLSSISFPGLYPAVQESCDSQQTGAGESSLLSIPAFPATPWPDANNPGISKAGQEAPTLRSSSPLKEYAESGTGWLRPLKSVPAPVGTTGLVQTRRKRKRRRYGEQERSETHLTRTIGGCIACRSRRKRVCSAC